MDVAHELSESNLLQCDLLVFFCCVRDLTVLEVYCPWLPVYVRLGWHVADDVGLSLVVQRSLVATWCLSFSNQLHDHWLLFYHN